MSLNRTPCHKGFLSPLEVMLNIPRTSDLLGKFLPLRTVPRAFSSKHMCDLVQYCVHQGGFGSKLREGFVDAQGLGVVGTAPGASERGF